MTTGLKLAAILGCLSLAACAQFGLTNPDASLVSGSGTTDAQVVMQSQYDIEATQVLVPRSLRVSDANVFYPDADIVWHGELPGDRHQQVEAIFAEAVADATSSMNTGRKVSVEFDLIRFHSVTPKTRFTLGGVHNVVFLMTLRDSATDAVIDGPRKVIANSKAVRGSKAIAEDQAGRTMRVVIKERLTEVLRRELSIPLVVEPADDPVTRSVSAEPLVPATLQ